MKVRLAIRLFLETVCDIGLNLSCDMFIKLDDVMKNGGRRLGFSKCGV